MPITHKATLPLYRPGEPSFVQKLDYRFDVPADHLPPRYKDIGVEILEHLNDENIQKIPVKQIKYPDLKFLKTFEKHATFSPFIRGHMKYAKALIKIFHSAEDLDELISLSLYVRDQINSQLFIYAYSVVLIHRYDSDNIEIPQLFEIAPQKFFDKGTLAKVRQAGHRSLCDEQRAKRQTSQSPPEPVEIPFRGTMNVSNPEEKLSFFREDLGVNSHHFHWHIVYPFDGPDPSYYDKDRRGELFFYMHHQLLNWYDCNRLSQRVPLLIPFDNFRESFETGYSPNMTTATSSYIIPSRPDLKPIYDLRRDSDSVQVKISDMERWYHRLQEAIDNGYCIDYEGNKIDLLNDKGIDILTNLLEATPLSLNSSYYGDLHNSGHNMISFIHDPDGKYKEPGGVMSDTSTAMRDPAFYRWHKMVDDLCVKLKNRLEPYRDQDLVFDGIKIKSLDLLDGSNKSTEQLFTFWQKTIVNLQNGLDFHVNKQSLVTLTHLNYQTFTYVMKVENQSKSTAQGTVRIFILPIYDEKGQQYLYEGSRNKAVEIDRFLIKIPPGTSRVTRKSTESTMTIPLDRIYPMQQDGTVLLSDQPEDIQAYCMCGWPQNLLLPKGTQDGYPFRIFVMISDYNLDRIDQNPSNGVCNNNYILCGLRNRKYPDKRSMGFPFDRPAGDEVFIFDDFMYERDNLFVKPMTIRHIHENMAQVGNDPNNLVSI